MSLIIATGSNVGDRKKNLELALTHLKQNFSFIASSSIYESAPQDYLAQDHFLNQVHEFKIPPFSPIEVLRSLQKIENKMGRSKLINKGPRNIDLDIIFWNLESFNHPELVIPHLSWIKRSFVVRPLSELPFYQTIVKHFTIPTSFDSDAFPFDS